MASLTANQAYGRVGKPKYLLSEKYSNKILGSADDQINMDMSRGGAAHA